MLLNNSCTDNKNYSQSGPQADQKELFIYPDSKYNLESNTIQTTQIDEYDLKARVGFHSDDFFGPISLCVNFEFYNYGKGISVQPEYREDIWLTTSTSDISICLISEEDIIDIKAHSHDTYGLYGIASIFTNNGKIENNVMVSPLVMNYLSSRKLDKRKDIVYLRNNYPEQHKYIDYLLLGDFTAAWVIKDFSEYISLSNPAFTPQPSISDTHRYKNY